MAAIAFIGLGQMGSPMASNLLQQGHQLRVFDVNAEAVRHLVDKGATPAANPAQAAKDAEFIITMLPNGDLVRSVLFGENGVCESLSTDALVIDMSTIHPRCPRNRRPWPSSETLPQALRKCNPQQEDASR